MRVWLSEHLQNLSVDELFSGVKSEKYTYTCIVCGMDFHDGVIYPSEDQLLDANRAISRHIQLVHGGMLSVLTALPKNINGLSDIQRKLINLVSEGRSDREIAKDLGGKAESTVRNHRFQLKRRIGEAKILAALGALVSSGSDSNADFISYHDDIPMADERIVTTVAEAKTILARYSEESDYFQLHMFPRKEKEKLVLLKRITGEFDRTRIYTEQEVNQVLKPIFADYVTIRRYLIEYRFLERKPGGSEYWVHA